MTIWRPTAPVQQSLLIPPVIQPNLVFIEAEQSDIISSIVGKLAPTKNSRREKLESFLKLAKNSEKTRLKTWEMKKLLKFH